MADMDRNERIRQRAYEIWEREGRPEGREADHWNAAERELFGHENSGAKAKRARGAPDTAAPRRASAASGGARKGGAGAKSKEGAGSVPGYGSTPANGTESSRRGGTRRGGKSAAAQH